MYRAWVSDATTSPETRFERFAGRYELPDGTLVANGWLQLTSNQLAHAIDMTELRTAPTMGTSTCGSFATVWTGTDAQGRTITDAHCANWSSSSPSLRVTMGDARESSSRWTSNCSNPSGDGCGMTAALYCFEQ